MKKQFAGMEPRGLLPTQPHTGDCQVQEQGGLDPEYDTLMRTAAAEVNTNQLL